MNIVFLGKGNMGAPLAKLATVTGHTVQAFGSQDNPLDALKGADLVFLATKYEQALHLAKQPDVAQALAGKIVVDITNPLAPDYMSLTVGHTTSAAEQLAEQIPTAYVVKAFNTVFASLLAKRAEGGDVAIPVFVAGNDSKAVEAVADLSRAFGFTTIVGGALSNARYLEPMAEFMIQLGYGLGHGDQIGFGLLKAE